MPYLCALSDPHRYESGAVSAASSVRLREAVLARALTQALADRVVALPQASFRARVEKLGRLP